MIIDALDEAASPAQARVIIDAVVLPLAETCSDAGAQVVVGTRRRDDGGDLLGRFGPALDLLDLDDPQYFAEEDLAAYALACLQLAGDERPGNPYADDSAGRPAGCRIAEMSGQNFLIAGLIARSHGLYDEAGRRPRPARTRPRSARRWPSTCAASPRCRRTRRPPAHRPGLCGGAGPARRAVAGGGRDPLPASVTVGDLARFARSSAANFLVETTGAATSGSVFLLSRRSTGCSTRRSTTPCCTPGGTLPRGQTTSERSPVRSQHAAGQDSGRTLPSTFCAHCLAMHGPAG